MLKFIQRLFTADQWTTRTATIRDFELSYDLNDAPVEITGDAAIHYTIEPKAQFVQYSLGAHFTDPLTSTEYVAWIIFADCEEKGSEKPLLKIGDVVSLEINQHFDAFRMKTPHTMDGNVLLKGAV